MIKATNAALCLFFCVIMMCIGLLLFILRLDVGIMLGTGVLGAVISAALWVKYRFFEHKKTVADEFN